MTEAEPPQDHPNLGLCLDVAHFPLAPSYGWDPITGEGWTEADYEKMIARLRAVPAEKIFYVELSDVLKPDPPLGQGSDFDAWREENRPLRGDSFVWVICARPVPFVGKNAGRSIKSDDDMGGARVVESIKAILSTGFKGVSPRFVRSVVLTHGRSRRVRVLRGGVHGERGPIDSRDLRRGLC